MVLSVLVVYLRDLMAVEELQLIAIAQHPERVSYYIALAREKIKMNNSKYYFY